MQADRFVRRELVDGPIRRRNGTIIDWREYKPLPTGREWYRSVYLFDDAILAHVEKHGSVKGFTGRVSADGLDLDIDNPDPAVVRDFALYLKRVHDFDLHHIWNSGTGWHVRLPGELFGGFAPSDRLPYSQKKLARRLEREAGLPDGTFDTAIYQTVHLIRCEHSVNTKTTPPRYKVPVDLNDVLDWDPSAGESPRRDFEHLPYSEFDKIDSLAAMLKGVLLDAPNPLDKPVVKPMFDQNQRVKWLRDGIKPGQRDHALFNIARTLKKGGIDKDEAVEITRAIRDARVERPEDFDDATVRTKVDSAYSDDTPDLSEHLDDYEPAAQKAQSFIEWTGDKIEGKIPPGYRLGIPTIDDVAAIAIGHTTGITSLTGYGKTHLLGQTGQIALRAGEPVLMIQAELPYYDVMLRAIAWRTGIDSRKLVAEGNRALLKEQADAIATLPFRVQCNGQPTIPYIEAHIQHWKTGFDAPGGLVLVDYAGLVSTAPGRGGEFSDQDAVANALADFAKRYECAILIAYQQNKNAWHTGVTLGNVAGGGGQAHRASVFILIERKRGGDNDAIIQVKLSVTKNRNGPQPSVMCEVDLRCGRFKELKGGDDTKPGFYERRI